MSWLAGSVRSEGPPTEGPGIWDRLIRRHGEDWVQSGAKHYGKGFRTADWQLGVYWDGQGDARGTVYVEARQTALARMSPADRLAIARAIRVRRLDMALDDDGLRVRPRDLFHAAREARSRTHKSRWRLELTDFGSMTTLYVGSRASGRMLRVYDKRSGSEGEFVVRHELELKGDNAGDSAAQLVTGWPTEAVYWAEYDKVARWPTLPGWTALRPS